MFAQNCIRIKVFTENFKQSDLECVVCSLMFCMRCARKYVKNYDLAYLVQSCLLINSKIQTIHFRNQWNPQHFTKLMSFDENSQITVYFCFVYFKTEIGVREGPQNLISLNRCQMKMRTLANVTWSTTGVRSQATSLEIRTLACVTWPKYLSFGSGRKSER